jgi:hypothetical protein
MVLLHSTQCLFAISPTLTNSSTVSEIETTLTFNISAQAKAIVQAAGLLNLPSGTPTAIDLAQAVGVPNDEMTDETTAGKR